MKEKTCVVSFRMKNEGTWEFINLVALTTKVKWETKGSEKL